MFWLKHKGKMQGNNFQVDKGPLMKIPIFVPDGDSDILDLINKVNQILQAKEKGLDTQPLEKEIDRLVYQLYGLSEEEVAVVEGSS
jgi:adenine-specific DNA-methyltransferase